MPRPYPLTAEQEAEAIRAYRGGESRNALARRFHCGRGVVNRLLDREGVQVRTLQEACTADLPNGNVFERAWERPEAAYFTGWLMADGCISVRYQNAKSIIAVVSAQDRGHLEKFRDFVGKPVGILTVPAQTHIFKGREVHSKEAARITFCTTALADTLIGYGVTPKKSKTARVCDELAMSPDFWRGVIDGDGNLALARYRVKYLRALIQLVGSESLMEQFAAFARHHTGTKGRVYFSKGVYCVNVQARMACNLIRLMYGHGGVSLDRKQAIADTIMSHVWRKMGPATPIPSAPPNRQVTLFDDL